MNNVKNETKIENERNTSEHHKPLFYTAFGSNGMALPSYAGHSEFVVIANVLAVAKNEGFKGTGKERMQELGWTVRPVFASPVATQGDQLDAERYRWLKATTNHITSNGERIDIRGMRDMWDGIIDKQIAKRKAAQAKG